MRQTLQPFLTSIENEQWCKTRERLFPNNEEQGRCDSSFTRGDKTQQIRHKPSTESHRPLSPTFDGVFSVGANQRDLVTSIEGQHRRFSRKYKVILRDDIGCDLRKQLKGALNFLLKRDEPFPAPCLSPKMSKAATNQPDFDDVSSIGHGGVSLGTNQGGAALQYLLTNVLADSKRESDAKQSATNGPYQTATDMFLTANQDGDSDEESDSSDITEPSFSGEGYHKEDDISVATSAFGKKALDDLLEAVAKSEVKDKPGNTGRAKRRAQQSNRGKKGATNYKRKRNTGGDDTSSVDQGRDALLLLLRNV
jgi:hypothetical protein